MRRATIAATLVVAAIALNRPIPPTEAQEACRFVLGFAALRDLIGTAVVGDCLEDEQHNPANGDGTQRTTKGLAVWRKASNTMAFTDGGTTWVSGPNGVQKRPNNYRFRWEPDGPMLNGGMGADPNEPVEMTPEMVRVTNANRRAAGLPPLDIGVSPAPPPAGSGDAATATAGARAAAPSAGSGQFLTTSVPATVAADATRNANEGATRVATLLATSTTEARATAAGAPDPTKTPAPSATARPSSGGGDKNCSDYKSQADAQAELRAHPEDRYGLDTDKDGIACESRPAPKDTRKVPR